MSSNPPTLLSLPTELLIQILYHLPSSSVPTLLRLCRRTHDLVPPLWKHYCRTEFRYWGVEPGEGVDVDWKGVFRERKGVDDGVREGMDGILGWQRGRGQRVEGIVGLGYGAKDGLLRGIDVGDGVEDVLARRYYSRSVLGCLHRTMAIKEWAKMTDRVVLLERALAAFDMFVLHEGEGDFDDVSARLNDIAQSIQIEIPDILEHSSRQKAIEIASYLRRNNLTGIANEGEYEDLQNNYIGIALREKTHGSRPMISVAIYCCVASRLGLDASPCEFPFHVLTIIKPWRSEDPNLSDADADLDPEPIYMDPFQSDQEIPVSYLKSQLLAMGVATSEHKKLLGRCSTKDVVRRAAWNIIASVQTIPPNRGDHVSTNVSSLDTECAFYGALWALILLPHGGMAEVLRPYIIEHLEKHFPMDVCLIEDYMLPLFWNLPQYAQLREIIRVMRASDAMYKPVKRRTRRSQRVRYYVGQAFKHKRYNYQAIITGWDTECSETEDWMSQMGVDDLSGGRHQSFYQVLVEDKSVRYVAEENIEIIQRLVSPNLMKLAGRHFKRWDMAASKFISNIRDEYPDD